MNFFFLNNNTNNQFPNYPQTVKNISSYVPFANYIPMMGFPQNYDYCSNFIPPQNFVNNAINMNQMQTEKESKDNNNHMNVETDSDIIQSLSGNYLNNNNEEKNNEDKNKKKEVKVNLGKIIIDGLRLKDFPMIFINDINKYNIFIPENILNKGEFLTAIKEKKENEEKNLEENEIVMEDDDNSNENKIIDKYLVNINENIKKSLQQIVNQKEIILCLENQKLNLYKIFQILYDKCINIISEIKNSIKNKKNKEKTKNISLQLKNIFELHNELRELFFASKNNNNDNSFSMIKEDKEEEENFITYAQFYLQSKGGKTSICQVCGKEFVNYQILGGHMSQYHRNVSEKYKKQSLIRKLREDKRKLLDYVKEKLFQKYNLDYRQLKKNEEKEKIKSFIKSHQKEYEVLRRKIYREQAIKDNCE